MSVTREARSGQDGVRGARRVQRSAARPPARPLQPEAHLPLDSPRKERSPAGLVTCSPAEVVAGESGASATAAGAHRAQAPTRWQVAGARSPREPPPGRARTPGAPGLPLLLRGGLVLGDPVLCDSVGSCGAPHGQDQTIHPSRSRPLPAPRPPLRAPTFCSTFPSFCHFTNVLQMEPRSDPATA